MSRSESEKVRNHIPNHLAFSVLSKLPLKSLKRFGCAYKPWSLLFEDPHFMNNFRTNFISIPHPYSNDTSLLLYQFPRWMSHDDFSLYSLSGERYENRVKLDVPNPFQEEKPYFDFLDSNVINGVICLKRGKRLVLWNPTTHEFNVIPQSPIESMPPYRLIDFYYHGFGFDHVREDIKIIRRALFSRIDGYVLRHLGVQRKDVSRNEISYEPLWEIYSQRYNSWRILDVNMPVCLTDCSNQRLYMDGICYWWSESENYDEHFLVSFNLSNELFLTTIIPLDIPSDMYPNFLYSFVNRHLVVFNGSIATISWYLSDKATYHISILGELGVKESWTKLFVVGPFSYIDRLIGAEKNCDILFQKIDGQLVCFDLSTQKTKELAVKGPFYYYVAFFYKKKSLFQLEE